MTHTTVFGMRVPPGPTCCGARTKLFRQEPLPDDDTRTRQYFRCMRCRAVVEIVVGDAERVRLLAGD